MGRSEGYICAPLSREVIRGRAAEVRRLLGVTTPKFPIVKVIDVVMPTLMPDFGLEILDRDEMKQRYGPDAHGMTYPDVPHMVIRQDVYLDACEPKLTPKTALARFSLAHEFGHLVLHTNLGLARRVAGFTPIFCNSEWQADTFAGELLVSAEHVAWDMTPESIASTFGVSFSAAKTQYQVFVKEGLI